MIKTLGLGIWICMVALGAAYLAAELAASAAETPAKPEENAAVEYMKTDALSVPVIRDGAVQGYVVAQVSFAMVKGEAGGVVLEDSAPYLMDAAFRAFYEAAPIDFSRLKPQDIAGISQKAKEYANLRLRGDPVKDVLIGDLNYVPRSEVRTNWVKQPR
jgi:hypothetical protein